MQPVLIVMGVSGVGKSTIAEALNQHLQWPYKEGDELHTQSSIDKMHHGIPLTDADRTPWLHAVKAWIDLRVTAGDPGIITCSALKRSYRDMLVDDRPQVRILYLKADVDILRARLAARSGHFMPAILLDSQLHTLEEPAADEYPLTVSVSGDVDDTVQTILGMLAEVVA